MGTSYLCLWKLLLNGEKSSQCERTVVQRGRASQAWQGHCVMLVGPWGLRAPAGRAARQGGVRNAAFAPGIQITTANQMPTWVHYINNSSLSYNDIFLPSIHYLLIYKCLSSWSPCLLFDWKIFKDVELQALVRLQYFSLSNFIKLSSFKHYNTFFPIKKGRLLQKKKKKKKTSQSSMIRKQTTQLKNRWKELPW